MANNTTNFSIRSVLEKDKLTGTNFLDWFRNLRIVLMQERKLHVLEVPHPQPLLAGDTCAGQNYNDLDFYKFILLLFYNFYDFLNEVE